MMRRSLATRLSSLFLLTLGIVLVGFSLLLHVFASRHLYQRLNERLQSAGAVLIAAIEVHDDIIEWEGKEREIAIGRDNGAERLVWGVKDSDMKLIDHSRNLAGNLQAAEWLMKLAGMDHVGQVADVHGTVWSVIVTRFQTKNSTDPNGRISVSAIIVATPLEPVSQTLSALDSWLVRGNLAILAAAAILGRWWAKRALSPLITMAESARGLDAADPGWTVPTSGNSDELDQLGSALNDLLSRLHVAYERQRRFAGDASHQLRTPLTIMLGQLEVALRRDRDSDEYRRVLGTVHAQTGNLAKIVEALLFLGRAEADAGRPELTPLDLATWLESHVAASRHQEKAFIKLKSHPVVSAHPALLGALVDNLLDNAVEHGRSDQPIEISLDVDRFGRSVLLSVQDFGTGIAPADLPQIFTPFFRSNEARRQGRPGVGLGLAVVERIAHVFGGSVWAESPPGAGARFIVKLPQITEVDAYRKQTPILLPEVV